MTTIAAIAVIRTMIVGVTATVAIAGTIIIVTGIATVDMTRTGVANWLTIDEVAAGTVTIVGGDRSNADAATSPMTATEVEGANAPIISPARSAVTSQTVADRQPSQGSRGDRIQVTAGTEWVASVSVSESHAGFELGGPFSSM